MKIRGVLVDHTMIQRLVYKFTPLLESEMKKRKGKVGASWRLDELYQKKEKPLKSYDLRGFCGLRKAL
jgi:putative transposase